MTWINAASERHLVDMDRAVAREREACAKLAESWCEARYKPPCSERKVLCSYCFVAARIRERSAAVQCSECGHAGDHKMSCTKRAPLVQSSEEKKGFICLTCKDTHSMQLEDQTVPCTRCPTPCESCRGHLSAYCASLQCKCSCHRKQE